MGDRIVIDKHAPQHEPDERDGAEEVKYIRPATRNVMNNKPTQEVGENVADLYACACKCNSLNNLITIIII